jgi:hypothetical protein
LQRQDQQSETTARFNQPGSRKALEAERSLQGVFVSQVPRSLVVHCWSMMSLLKRIGICLLIVFGLIAFAILRAMSNILSRR